MLHTKKKIILPRYQLKEGKIEKKKVRLMIDNGSEDIIEIKE